MKSVSYLIVGVAFFFLLGACNSSGSKSSKDDDSTVVKMEVDVSDQTAAQVDSFLNAYYRLKDALVDDDSMAAVAAAAPLMEKLDDVSLSAIADSKQREKAKVEIVGLKTEIAKLQKDSTLKNVRSAFEMISEDTYRLVKVAGLKNVTVYRTHCPMAFNDKGADWLSSSSAIRNPYFGHSMINCGIVKETLEF